MRRLLTAILLMLTAVGPETCHASDSLGSPAAPSWFRLSRSARSGFFSLGSPLAAPRTALQLDELLRGLGLPRGGGAPNDGTITAGLKQALEIGTTNAVAVTGTLDGFFRNEAIKILLPERLRRFESTLRAVGLGPQVDEVVLGMNRAAERAAPAATRIFVDAVRGMTFDDARRVLTGGNTAATDYFRERTTDALAGAFRPTVERAMDEVGVVRQYRALLDRARLIPFLDVEGLELEPYVVSRALDGLFHVVAEEERKIRTDPTARVTDLLRQVFK